MSRSWVQVCLTFSPLPHRTDPSKSARAISRVIDVDGIHSPCYILATIQLDPPSERVGREKGRRKRDGERERVERKKGRKIERPGKREQEREMGREGE